MLSERTATPTSQLKFIVDAWMQVGGRAAGRLPGAAVRGCPGRHRQRLRSDWLGCQTRSAMPARPPDAARPLAPPPPQVVHCRRVLKWTYATAYYTFEESAGASAAARQRMAQHQEFFEFNQARGACRAWVGCPGVAPSGQPEPSACCVSHRGPLPPPPRCPPFASPAGPGRALPGEAAPQGGAAGGAGCAARWRAPGSACLPVGCLPCRMPPD